MATESCQQNRQGKPAQWFPRTLKRSGTGSLGADGCIWGDLGVLLWLPDKQRVVH